MFNLKNRNVMKENLKPTLEEVKEYFKDAEIVECISNSIDVCISKNVQREIHYENYDYWVEVVGYKIKNVNLWSEKIGYAKIIKYKETMNYKEVILSERPKDEQVYLDDLNYDSIVGYITDEGDKRMIRYYGDTLFSLSDESKIMDKLASTRVKEFFKWNVEFINKIYTFNTVKDCYKWMAE
jgi:hypothetical protein